ncbi:PREDICTED: reticulon-4 receptor-like 2 [Myotis brandtii]|uniref:reticulon-4 receptor-like 2 n=1 Tax=Myotis brandtii TaxID=109478 RepID=UPI000703ED75|nr:PREDICTED: reticulon-4 receptor-like 2 [Myotis brandtii]
MALALAFLATPAAPNPGPRLLATVPEATPSKPPRLSHTGMASKGRMPGPLGRVRARMFGIAAFVRKRGAKGRETRRWCERIAQQRCVTEYYITPSLHTHGAGTRHSALTHAWGQPAHAGRIGDAHGPASACLLLLLLALPPAAPSCPMLCTCYSSPPTVSCQANNFSSVPLSLPPSTQRLFLQNNLIRTLRPGTFGPNLLTLWLFSNNLSTIYPGTFRHLQALEELDLGDNRHLRSLEPDTFQGLERLQSLHLYRCQLSSLPANIFRGLVSLQYLYLQENSLLHLQDDLFADLANLSHLFLHGNRLRLLTEHVFRGLGGLDRLLRSGSSRP